MITVVDRVAQNPGRVKLTPVSGQTNVYDMERADNPSVVGTPINKALFDSIANDINALTVATHPLDVYLTYTEETGSYECSATYEQIYNSKNVAFHLRFISASYPTIVSIVREKKATGGGAVQFYFAVPKYFCGRSYAKLLMTVRTDNSWVRSWTS